MPVERDFSPCVVVPRVSTRPRVSGQTDRRRQRPHRSHPAATQTPLRRRLQRFAHRRRSRYQVHQTSSLDPTGTVTLIGMCSGAVGFGAVAMDQLWVVGISGGSVEFGNLIQTAKRSTISVRHRVALSRCRRGRKCAEMPLNADTNRWAWRTDLKRFIARSRCRVG